MAPKRGASKKTKGKSGSRTNSSNHFATSRVEDIRFVLPASSYKHDADFSAETTNPFSKKNMMVSKMA